MLGPLDARIYGVRYGDRHLVKQLPPGARRWSKPLGCWITPTHVVNIVRIWLEAVGYDIAIVDVRNVPTGAVRSAAIPLIYSETTP